MTTSLAEMDTVIRELESVDVFQILDIEETRKLAAHARRLSVGPDTRIVTQDEAGSSLFVVTSGLLKAYHDEGGRRVELGTLGPTDYFGEMSLLTGAQRSATVEAVEATELFEITKAGLAPLMAGHPTLAARMGETLTRRQSSNLRTLMERPDFGTPAPDEAKNPGPADGATRVGDRIRSFFKLPRSR